MLFNLDLVLTDSHSSLLWCRTLYVTWQLNLEYQSHWLSQVFPVAFAWYNMQLWFTLLTFLFQRSSANLRASLAHLIVRISRKHGQTSWNESSVFWAAGSVWMLTWRSRITRHTFTLRQAHLLGHWVASAIVYTVETKFHREVLLLVNGVIECWLYEMSSCLGHRLLAPNWII